MPGQEAGNAIASVLFGDVNPSARLPVTFPTTDQQTPVNTPAQYPGINDQSEYSEQLLVGYRWYDAKNQNPLFPFGHGLSYTTFEYSAIAVHARTVQVYVQNTGSMAGVETVQLYLGYPPSAGEPPKVLRRVKKVALTPNQKLHVEFTLADKDLSIWDVRSNNWMVVKGEFTAYVGASSRDIKQTITFTN
jgi:beta-glucosidase